jgi:hypothetical protein
LAVWLRLDVEIKKPLLVSGFFMKGR